MVNVKPLNDKEKADENVFDVAKPGEKPAHANSKPVIVGNKPEIDDPMVKTSQQINQETPSASEKLAKPEEAKTDEQPSKEPEEKTATEDDKTSTEQKEKAQKSSEADEELERMEHLDELVESKKFFVPISKTSASNNLKTFILTFLVVLVVGGIVVVALIDSGILDLGVNLPFDLIKS